MAKGPPVKFKQTRNGWGDLATRKAMAAHTLKVAEKLKGAAAARGDSTYTARSRSVRTGWRNEARAGAVVSEVKKDWRDSRDKVLIRVTEAMKVRGRR